MSIKPQKRLFVFDSEEKGNSMFNVIRKSPVSDLTALEASSENIRFAVFKLRNIIKKGYAFIRVVESGKPDYVLKPLMDVIEITYDQETRRKYLVDKAGKRIYVFNRTDGIYEDDLLIALQAVFDRYMVFERTPLLEQFGVEPLVFKDHNIFNSQNKLVYRFDPDRDYKKFRDVLEAEVKKHIFIP